MLKIGQFTDTFLPIVDGVGRVAVAYAEGLCRLGHQVSVIAPVYNTGYRGGLPYEIIDFTGISVPGTPQYRTGEAIMDAHYRQRIEATPLEICHTHSPFSAGTEALRLSIARNIPLVGTFHSKYYDDFLKATKSKQLAKIATKLVVDFYTQCDEVWAVNGNTAEVLRSYGYEGDIIVMQNGVNPSVLKPGMIQAVNEQFHLGDEPVLLFVGQMNWKKNILTILEACSLLKKDGCRFSLILAGQGPDLKAIQEKVTELDLENVTHFAGHVTNPDLLSGLYARAGLFVFPSLYDNAPLVVREAAVMGTPSVMVRGSTAADIIIDNKTGFLCENSPEDLRTVMGNALKNQELLQNIGQNAQETIPVSWDDVLKEALARYEALIEKGKRGQLKEKTRRVL